MRAVVAVHEYDLEVIGNISVEFRLGEVFSAPSPIPLANSSPSGRKASPGLVTADVLEKVLHAVFFHVGAEPVIEEVDDLTARTFAVLDAHLVPRAESEHTEVLACRVVLRQGWGQAYLSMTVHSPPTNPSPPTVSVFTDTSFRVCFEDFRRGREARPRIRCIGQQGILKHGIFPGVVFSTARENLVFAGSPAVWLQSIPLYRVGSDDFQAFKDGILGG